MDTPTATVQQEASVLRLASASAPAEDGFRFLPPIGSKPGTLTDFDPNLDVVVQICTTDPCGTPHASFSVSAGTVTVDEVNGQYVAEWKTKVTEAPIGSYHVRVLVGSQELGVAHLQVINPGRSKTVIPPGTLAVTRGSTVPIKFFVKKGALWLGPVLFQSRFMDVTNLPEQTESAYRAAITAKMAEAPTEGYCDTYLPQWKDVANKLVCTSGSPSGIAYQISARVTIPADQGGTWRLKLGGDFGRGFYWALDGEVVQFVPYTGGGGPWDPVDLLPGLSVSLSPGLHTVTIAGFEDCCDGASTSTISADGVNWSIIPALPSVAALTMSLESSVPSERRGLRKREQQ